jgi:hypothetical protein
MGREHGTNNENKLSHKISVEIKRLTEIDNIKVDFKEGFMEVWTRLSWVSTLSSDHGNKV